MPLALPAVVMALLSAASAGDAPQEGLDDAGPAPFDLPVGMSQGVDAGPGAPHAEVGLGTPKATTNASADATDEGLFLGVEDRLGRQSAGLHWVCVPDQHSACDTRVDCEPGTWNCWATRQQRDGWKCRIGDDGIMVCRG